MARNVPKILIAVYFLLLQSALGQNDRKYHIQFSLDFIQDFPLEACSESKRNLVSLMGEHFFYVRHLDA